MQLSETLNVPPLEGSVICETGSVLQPKTSPKIPATINEKSRYIQPCADDETINKSTNTDWIFHTKHTGELFEIRQFRKCSVAWTSQPFCYNFTLSESTLKSPSCRYLPLVSSATNPNSCIKIRDTRAPLLSELTQESHYSDI